MAIPRFSGDASLYSTNQHYAGGSGLDADHAPRVTPALVGRWNIPWSNCEVVCIEVCTRFCHPTGWDCCGWETRCALNCSGTTILTTY
jgi:hypothetical protein